MLNFRAEDRRNTRQYLFPGPWHCFQCENRADTSSLAFILWIRVFNVCPLIVIRQEVGDHMFVINGHGIDDDAMLPRIICCFEIGVW